MFLIASGYGLSESSAYGFQAKQFFIKRVATVIVPYLIMRIVMLPATEDASIVSFVLDVLCIRPKYILGWYLVYIIFWYMVFFFAQFIPEKYKRYEIAVYLFVSVMVFLSADSALQAQQAFSFTTGVIISKKKNKILGMMKYAGIRFLVLTGVGMGFFICKQALDIMIWNIPYMDYVVKMGYHYIWGIDVFIIIYIFRKCFKFTMFETLGIISYEIFLIHGYFIESGFMNSIKMLFPCVVINIAGAIVLHQVCGVLKNLLFKDLVRRKV